MKLGFVPVLDPTGGGVYQYGASVAYALRDLRSAKGAVALIAPGSDLPPFMRGWASLELPLLSPPDPQARRLPFVKSERLRSGLRKIRRRVQRRSADLDRIRLRREPARLLRFNAIDLTLFPAPLAASFEIGLPYVMAIHDLQHRLQPEFPEVSANGVWESREYLFRNGARYASVVLADSEVGREDILDAYSPHGLDEERVSILPFAVPPVFESGAAAADEAAARIWHRYALPERYLFYPAQFWPHKNHLRLVEALGILRRRNMRVALVLTGSWSGTLRERTFEETMRHARSFNVDEQLTVLGYVPDSDMAGLYRGAAALVFPTFFGPTNLPIIEAWALGCPVVTSDIRGIREQVGDAALIADPREPEALAAAIEQVWTDEELCRRLVARGRVRVQAFTPEDFRRRLTEILDRAVALGPPGPTLERAL
jgi:glycosyltransferase involved in cell wall biosynthesis